MQATRAIATHVLKRVILPVSNDDIVVAPFVYTNWNRLAARKVISLVDHCLGFLAHMRAKCNTIYRA